MPFHATNKRVFIHLFRHEPRLLIYRQKKHVPNLSEMDIKKIIPAPTRWILVYRNDWSFPHKSEKNCQKFIKLNIFSKKNSYLHDQIHLESYCACPLFKCNFRAELGLFLLRSSFLLPGSSFWAMRSRTVTYSLVALLFAVLLKWKKLVTADRSVIGQNDTTY